MTCGVLAVTRCRRSGLAAAIFPWKRRRAGGTRGSEQLPRPSIRPSVRHRSARCCPAPRTVRLTTDDVPSRRTEFSRQRRDLTFVSYRPRFGETLPPLPLLLFPFSACFFVHTTYIPTRALRSDLLDLRLFPYTFTFSAVTFTSKAVAWLPWPCVFDSCQFLFDEHAGTCLFVFHRLKQQRDACVNIRV